MTKFDKTKFRCHGGYLTYNDNFVARFKYRRDGMAHFRAFLIKNFTVAEYFDLYVGGLAPLMILRTKGYVSPKMAKADGPFIMS